MDYTLAGLIGGVIALVVKTILEWSSQKFNQRQAATLQEHNFLRDTVMILEQRVSVLVHEVDDCVKGRLDDKEELGSLRAENRILKGQKEGKP